MLLSTRVTLIVALALTVLCGALAVVMVQRDALAERRYADAMLTGQETFWAKLVENTGQRLEARAGAVAARLAQAKGAMAAGPALDKLLADSLAPAAAARIEMVDLRGKLLGSAGGRSGGNRLLDNRALAVMAEAGAPLVGMSVGEEGGIWVTATVSVGPGAGFLTLAAPLADAAREFRAGTGAEILMVSRTGEVVGGTAAELWPGLKDRVTLGKRALATAETGGRVYSIGTIKMRDSLNRFAGNLVTIKDVTVSHVRQRELTYVSAVGIALFLGIVIFGFFAYLQRTFDPLREAVTVLHAISNGETGAGIQSEGGEDEIGRIASSINQFREQAITHELSSVQRARRRRWREGVICQQMLLLCEHLPGASRQPLAQRLKAVHDDMRRAGAESSALDAEDGLAPTVTAVVAAAREVMPPVRPACG